MISPKMPIIKGKFVHKGNFSYWSVILSILVYSCLPTIICAICKVKEVKFCYCSIEIVNCWQSISIFIKESEREMERTTGESWWTNGLMMLKALSCVDICQLCYWRDDIRSIQIEVSAIFFNHQKILGNFHGIVS